MNDMCENGELNSLLTFVFIHFQMPPGGDKENYYLFLVFNGSKYLFLLFFPLFSVPGREGFIINFTFHCLSFSTSIVSVTFLINILRFFFLFSLLLAFVNRLSSRLNFHSSSHERIHLFTRSFFEKVFTRREFTIPKNGTSFLGVFIGEKGEK